MVKVEIIATGNELLRGEVENSTTPFLLDQFLGMGYEIGKLITICDDREQIKRAVREALTRAEVIVITGGLGPTPDDLTREALAGAINQPLEFRPEIWEAIQLFFRTRNRETPPANIKQAYLPQQALAVFNSLGTAPGIIVAQGSQTIIALPGPPGELIQMFVNEVKPYLKERYQVAFFQKRCTFKVFGLGESAILEKLKELLKEIKDMPAKICFLPRLGEVHLILQVTGVQKEVESLFFRLEEKVKCLLGPDLYGVDEATLPGKVGELLRTQNLTLGVAESCTGGLIGNYLTNVPGSSDFFRGGIIAYTNDIKEKLLGVKAGTLAGAGAVSPETAEEMALGICRVLRSDFGLATTGIAGPSGGLPENPVGTVYAGLATPSGTFVKKFFYPGVGRITVKTLAAKGALDFLRRFLINPDEVG
ncbi:MAG: competence/damage-inducible protein A [Bacillota bacterium]|nr:competence/damage-inducible protein A [Bacillota bacterium]